MKPTKTKLPRLKTAHTPNTKLGSGDFYGSGVKNPQGKRRDSYMLDSVKTKNMGKKPKTLA